MEMLRLAVFLFSALFANAGIGGVDLTPPVVVGGCTVPEVKCLATDTCVSAVEAATSACTDIVASGCSITDMEALCPTTGECVTIAELESPTIYAECFPTGVPSSMTDVLGSYTGLLGAGATGPNGCVATAGEAWCPGESRCIEAGEVLSNPDACSVVDLDTITGIGGDRDPTFGCYTAAGYIWCPSLDKCVKPWEEPCADLDNLPDTPNYADSTGIDVVIIGGGKDPNGCYIAGGQQYCPSTQKCVQPWTGECADFEVDLAGLSGAATEIEGGQKDDHGCYTSAGFTWCASTQTCHQSWEDACARVAAAPTATPTDTSTATTGAADTSTDTSTATTGAADTGAADTGTNTNTNTNTTDELGEDGAASSQQPIFIIIATLCALSML